MAKTQNELVFAPLGGVGEIGMNLGLYGFGNPRSRKWLMVDLGVAFADDALPGIDLIMADTRFIEDERDDLLAIILTHAHEDHFGAVIDLWPRLRVPVYATAFTAGLLKAKMIEERVDLPIPIHIVPLGGTVDLEPFSVEFVTVTHSIPEPNGLAIRTPLGMVYHSGDWKVDHAPQIGADIDVTRLTQLGEEGCKALICDSTNAVRDGVSPSEGDVFETLKQVIAGAPNRVAVTAFASNVARLRSVALAAQACGRRVAIAGRAMHRIVAVAREAGYLHDVPPFLGDDEFQLLPRNKVAVLVTGSQGEPRAALARVAFDDHPLISLVKGDTVVFSSRTIPGNEKAVGRVQNALVRAGIEIITDADGLVHVSGHPRRGELEQMYGWLKPDAIVPVHGEARHLEAHARLAESHGIAVARAVNGDVVRLLPGPAEKVDELPAGRVYKDGKILIGADDEGLRERKRLAYSGCVVVSVVTDRKGELVGEPDAVVLGIPEADDLGELIYNRVLDAVDGTIASIPKARRKDPDRLAEAVRRAVRAAVAESWGKRPVCEVIVTQA